MFSCANCAEKCCDKGLGCTPLPADKGQVYIDLVQQTGGVVGDLCIQDFGPVFQDMATGVVQSAQLSCDYAIPAPPQGSARSWQGERQAAPPSGQMVMPILHVATPADCGVKGGWCSTTPTRRRRS